jgi:hypothetical protein
LRRETQTVCRARLSQLCVPNADRFRRHDRKGTPADTAGAMTGDGNTHLITITIRIDSP